MKRLTIMWLSLQIEVWIDSYKIKSIKPQTIAKDIYLLFKNMCKAIHYQNENLAINLQNQIYKIQ